MHSTQHVANRCKSKWGLAALEQSGFYLFLLLLLLSPDSKRTGRPLMVNSDTFWFAWSKTWRGKSCMFMNEFGQGLSGMGFLFPGRGDWSRNWQKD